MAQIEITVNYVILHVMEGDKKDLTEKILVKTEITFKQLTEIEPGLQTLYNKAKNYKPGENYCHIPVWYREFKPRLLYLVGWDARKDNELLKSRKAYDLAYKTVLNALPGCPKGCKGCDG